MQAYTNLLDKIKDVLDYEIVLSKIMVKTLAALTFIALITLGAYVKVPLPFTPIPITLQTFFVILSAVCLGAKWGTLSQLGYLFLGYLGLPIFTNASSGFFVFMGPTGGYLIGFVISVYVIGRLIRIKDNFKWSFFVLFIGALIILFSGTLWLKIIIGLDFKKSFLIGFIPFLPGDILKVISASYFYSAFKYKFKGF